jgi:hypothetical protein
MTLIRERKKGKGGGVKTERVWGREAGKGRQG